MENGGSNQNGASSQNGECKKFSLDDLTSADLEAVEDFRTYLRFPTVHPEPDYSGCVQFLCDVIKRAAGGAVTCEVLELAPNNPAVFAIWPGVDGSLPGLLLNSHMDVVPVFPEHWTHDPFAAEVDAHGDVYARGAQDMKCVGMQYLHAIKRLHEEGFKPKRTIYILFVPDEEHSGTHGMHVFVETDFFKSLNIGFVLDEGLASTGEEFTVFNGERSIRHITVTCTGNTGHGSRFIENLAVDKLTRFLGFVSQFRKEQRSKLLSDSGCISLGEVTTVNVTQLNGGIAHNVVPQELTMVVDCRVATDFEINEFESMLDLWARESGDGVSWTYTHDNVLESHSETELKDSNKFWRAFQNACSDMKLRTQIRTFPAASDSRFLREVGLDAIGFSPMNRTPILLHDHNERLNVHVYLRGIRIYASIITHLANC